MVAGIAALVVFQVFRTGSYAQFVAVSAKAGSKPPITLINPLLAE